MIKKLNQQVDLKLLIKTISVVLVISLICCAGYFSFQEVRKTVWFKKIILWNYLKKNSVNSNFTASYDFDIKSTIDKIKSNITAATNQLNMSNSNLVQLQKQLADLRREHEQLLDKIGSFKSRASYLEEELFSNQRRLTNQIAEYEIARSNVNYRLKTLEDLRAQVKIFQDKYTRLTNEIASAKTNLADLRANQKSLKTNYDNLTLELKTGVKSAEAHRVNITRLEKTISEIDDQLTKNQVEIENLLKQKENVKDTKSIQEIENKISALDKKNNALQSEKTQHSEKLNNLRSTQVTLDRMLIDYTNSLVKVQAQIDNLQKEMDSLTKTIAQKETEASDLRRQISNLTSTLSDKESSLKSHRNNLAQLETNLFNRQTNISFLKTNAMEKRREMLRLGVQLSENEKLQARVKDEIQKTNTKIDELRKKISALQRDLSQKENEALNQYRYFARDIASRINSASSYPAIYHIIGQQLRVTERLLKEPQIEKRIEGVKIAFDSMRYALDPAQNYWLACRIVDVYLFPNIALLKGTEADRQVLDQIFSYSVNAFQNNEEDDNVVRAYELHLANTSDEKRANTVRYYLSLQYEQKGDLEKSIYYLKQITDTTNFAYAVSRIPALEAKIEKLKKK